MPEPWTVEGLARRIISGTSPLMEDRATDDIARITKTDAALQRGMGAAATLDACTDQNSAGAMTPSEHGGVRVCAIQGFEDAVVSAARWDTRSHDRPRRHMDRKEPDPRRFQRAREKGRDGRTNGRSTRRPRRAKVNTQCRACRRFGHEADTCDQLAMFSYIMDYMKRAPPGEVDAARRQWMERHRKLLEGSRSMDPNKVAAVYCSEIPGMTLDEMVEQLDYDFIESTKDPEFDDDATTSEE